MNYAHLIKAINSATAQLQGRAAAAVNQSLVVRNWLVGAYLVEFEQHGKDRARYGDRLLERVAEDLAARKAKGLDLRTLRDCRAIYFLYPQIRGTLSPEFAARLKLPSIPSTLMTKFTSGIRGTASRKSASALALPPIRRTPSVESARTATLFPIRGTVSPELPTPFSPQVLLQFSWSKLQELTRLDDPWKRAFYENECLKGNWSVRQLQRQIGSLLYERTGLSKNKAAVIQRARSQETRETISDLIRDPYVLEFTGLAERPEYRESELERALLDHLQNFLLELGEGFCFEARQRRITVGGKHDYIDLVFYHRRLRCHVLIDLKIRAFQHGDAGQMNFYLNWWKTNAVEDGDLPPIGIILCSERDRVGVEFATAGLSNKLFVSRYLVALPSAEQLRTFLEKDRARIESLMTASPNTRKVVERRGATRTRKRRPDR
ncbi:MAG: DUF1016 family protein [Verrucomicrobia bacterium]|nr:DUF1016 family protein [Verrucomicrobiota bacterium]